MIYSLLSSSKGWLWTEDPGCTASSAASVVRSALDRLDVRWDHGETTVTHGSHSSAVAYVITDSTTTIQIQEAKNHSTKSRYVDQLIYLRPPGYFFFDCWTLKIKSPSYSETLGTIRPTIQDLIPQELSLQETAKWQMNRLFSNLCVMV